MRGSVTPSAPSSRQADLITTTPGEARRPIYASIRVLEKLLKMAERRAHAARDFIKALRAVVAVAITAGLRPDDSTIGIRVKLRASTGFKTWPEDAMAKLKPGRRSARKPGWHSAFCSIPRSAEAT
jgi:hypothetical protein